MIRSLFSLRNFDMSLRFSVFFPSDIVDSFVAKVKAERQYFFNSFPSLSISHDVLIGLALRRNRW